MHTCVPSCVRAYCTTSPNHAYASSRTQAVVKCAAGVQTPEQRQAPRAADYHTSVSCVWHRSHATTTTGGSTRSCGKQRARVQQDANAVLTDAVVVAEHNLELRPVTKGSMQQAGARLHLVRPHMELAMANDTATLARLGQRGWRGTCRTAWTYRVPPLSSCCASYSADDPVCEGMVLCRGTIPGRRAGDASKDHVCKQCNRSLRHPPIHCRPDPWHCQRLSHWQRSYLVPVPRAAFGSVGTGGPQPGLADGVPRQGRGAEPGIATYGAP